VIIVVMGVSGSGKSTIGQQLAERLGWPFYDGDTFHPAANIEKMSRGIPLDDADRADWLTAIADRMRELSAAHQSGVFACSALKQKYRDQLMVNALVRYVYLKGSYDLIWQRMQSRPGHYMKAIMLASQFATLEEPREALTIEIDQPAEQIIDRIVTAIQSGHAE
jgi:gluconokinase